MLQGLIRHGQNTDRIAEGRAKGMPAWGPRVPERQIWQLVAYIRSLGTDDEPARPRE